MIAASEPLEFVPHGRTVLEKHPTKIYSKGANASLSEHSLLYKLTNCVIKDESLLRDVEEQESWFVRLVYARATDDFEDDPPPSPKDAKDECMSESFRPPSRLKTDFNMSIKSELMTGVRRMETDCPTGSAPSRAGSANSSSNMSKKFNLTSAQSTSSTERPLNPKTDSCYEEELYVKGCTAVWSKGLISTPATRISDPESRETIACYTIENPIKHAVFCNFHVSINNTMLIDALNSQIGDVKKNIKIEDTTEHLPTKIMPSILLIDNKCVKVYATDGREYVTSIPFQVKKVWPMKYGVLLEKDATPLIHNSLLPTSFMKLNESHNSTFSKSQRTLNMSAKLRQESLSLYDNDVPLPTCFSMAHPLDEVTPLLMKSPSHGLQYYNDGDLQIIFVSTAPSIILLYDWKLGTHSLWTIRKALRDECLTLCPNVNSTTTVFSQSCDFASPMTSHAKNTTSWATGVGSPFQSKKATTPTTSRSRLNSPMANILHQQGLSPHASIGQASMSMMANTMQQAPPSLPLYPDVCLDHIWTDSQSIKRDPIESPSDVKSFLHTDLVGHNYLCFMVKVGGQSRLQIVRLQRSNSTMSAKPNIIVGSGTSVAARDAVVLEHLQMMALIDDNGNIILQSGTSVVGKVHVGGVLARLIDSPYTKRTTFQSPFPRRSSLLPSRTNDPAFDDSALHLLSPVPHSSVTRVEQKESLGLRALSDAAGSRLTLRFDRGPLYRIALPELACSALVARCCAALRGILPKDVTMQVLIKWYGARNAPGTQDLTPEQEWSMFADLLYTLIGYDLEKLSLPRKSDDWSENTEVATKKQRTSSDGTQDDWDYLLTSKLHKTFGNSLANVLNLTQTCKGEAKPQRPSLSKKKSQTDEKSVQFNANAILFPYTAQVLYAFHLVYEDTKLNTLLLNELQPLSAFLCQLSKDLRLDKYVTHYWLDFTTELALEYEEGDSQMTDTHLKKLLQPSYFTQEPPHLFAYLNAMLKDLDVGYYPYLAEVNDLSRNLIEILATIECGRAAGVHTVGSRDSVAAASTPRTPRTARAARDRPSPADAYSLAITLMAERGITLRDIDNLPPAPALLLHSILAARRARPPPGSAALLQRHDLAPRPRHAALIEREAREKETAYSRVGPREPERGEERPDASGMEHLNTALLRLLYPTDHRMSEVFNLLQSSVPVTINLTQRPEVSDHDFIEEQEKYLYAVGTRTMALPVARGMLTLRTVPCVPTEPLAAPRLCVSGRGPPPRCHTIELGGAETSAMALAWPQFHNGAAAGLALLPASGATIRASWLLYNKPKGTTEMSNEHAGFLLALGLNGHLKDMPFLNIYEYLVKCHEMISVGLLLGLAATYRGTMDVQASKMMSIHLEPLLPPTCVELELAPAVQCAALLGAGLLHQRSQHAHLARVLLGEIGKPPGPEMENCVEREGYALSAGLALGLVCAGAGGRAPHYIAHALRTYMLGGDRPPRPGFQKDKYKQGSFAIREGSSVNLDVTSPGATLALGLIFLGSGNRAVASWLEPPATSYLLDYVRPDLLMLRSIARGLILWNEVEPDEEWIEAQVPQTIKPYCFVKPAEDNIDYEAMNQAYCNIVAGACFTIGLRYAGSGCEDARDTLLHYTNFFLTLAGKSLAELAGKSTLESCVCVCLLAAGMVTAGRGDIAVLRVCRRLRARLPVPAPATATVPGRAQRPPPLGHGPQMAVHSTIGLLFLGGGRCTLSTTPEAIGALLAAFFPKFPTHSEDNRYHLQAFRHLYVLATEARLFLPRDLNTGRLCYANIQVVDLSGVTTDMKAPCLLPPLDSLREVRLREPRYWPATYHRGADFQRLQEFLDNTWCIDIKPRAGCLSYLDDPQGFQTILAQTLTLDKANIWSAAPENIELFTSDDKVRNFTKHYLASLDEYKANVGSSICPDCLLTDKKKSKKGVRNETLAPKQCQCRKYSKEELEFVQGLSMVTYECVVKDILCALPVWTTFLKILKSTKTDPSAYHIWQIKLLLSQIEYHNRKTQNEMKIDGEETCHEPLISNEFTIAIGQKIGSIFDSYEAKITPYLRKYLGLPSSRKIGNAEELTKKILSAFLVYHDIPKGVLRGVNSDNMLEVLLELENLSLNVNAMSKIESLL